MLKFDGYTGMFDMGKELFDLTEVLVNLESRICELESRPILDLTDTLKMEHEENDE